MHVYCMYHLADSVVHYLYSAADKLYFDSAFAGEIRKSAKVMEQLFVPMQDSNDELYVSISIN